MLVYSDLKSIRVGYTTILAYNKNDKGVKMQVKELRQAIGVTQKKLAETSGLDLRWIQKVESGEISMENITVKRFFSLLRGIAQCADDCDENKQMQVIRDAYSSIEQLL